MTTISFVIYCLVVATKAFSFHQQNAHFLKLPRSRIGSKLTVKSSQRCEHQCDQLQSDQNEEIMNPIYSLDHIKERESHFSAADMCIQNFQAAIISPKIYFSPKSVKAAIVTCGGICKYVLFPVATCWCLCSVQY